jgi:type IV secretory pathway VirB4 component
MKESVSTQKFVEIEEIRDGILILKNGALRRILMVSGINFELKAEEEQNAISYVYQSFLNSLDFSIQFIIHSRKLNIEAYLEKLNERQEQEANELLKNQITEYIEFIRSFVELNAVMTKTFFAIVAYDPIIIPSGGKKILEIFKFGKKTATPPLEQTLNTKIIQLNQRVDQIINGLNQIGLRVVALNDEELIELFYNLYNPETVEKKDLKIAYGKD